ncbi:MAG: protein disulfide oxidoreductase [Candidatus Micrarchaeia archaeon]
MGFLNDKDVKYIKDLFEKNLDSEVNLMLFVDSPEKCQYCKDTIELLTELANTSPKIKLIVYDINKNSKEAKFLGVDKTPALIIGGKKVYNIYYFGIPAGHEFAALLEDIVDASRGTTRLSNTTKEKLKEIKDPVEIKVFVTPTCPYCPRAVRIAHEFAMENDKIKGVMIEAMEFYDLANQYSVMAVPKIVINDEVSFEGALPEEEFLRYVLSAVNKD